MSIQTTATTALAVKACLDDFDQVVVIFGSCGHGKVLALPPTFVPPGGVRRTRAAHASYWPQS